MLCGVLNVLVKLLVEKVTMKKVVLPPCLKDQSTKSNNMRKPILAAKCPPDISFEDWLAKIRYPVLVTPKIDGIRCMTDGDCVPPKGWQCYPHTRALKDIPNIHTRELIGKECPPWLDGELTCGDNFQAVTSGIMTHMGSPRIKFYVFDYGFNNPEVPYMTRVANLNALVLPWFITKLFPSSCSNVEELLIKEQEFLAQGAEGLMFRNPNSIYKHGRSSMREQYLVAIKRFSDGEARITDFNEAMHNGNAPMQSKLGYQVRSSHKAGMHGKDTLGSLTVTDLKTLVSFNVGTGFDDATRQDIWRNKDKYLGKIIKYRWQNHGVKDKPRIPSFLGIRTEEDMS